MSWLTAEIANRRQQAVERGTGTGLQETGLSRAPTKHHSGELGSCETKKRKAKYKADRDRDKDGTEAQ
jgi:hypothetical protein